MNKNNKGRKNTLIVIITLIIVLIAVLCYFFAYKYPIHFLSKDDLTLEYEGEKYIKYTGDKWTFFFGSKYDELIGFSGKISWGVYTSLDKSDDFILLKQHNFFSDKVYFPEFYYNKDVEFGEPSLENIEYVEVQYYNADFELNSYKSEDAELINELLDLIENREKKEILEYDDYICEIFFVSSMDEYLKYFVAVLEGNDSYYLRDNQFDLITTTPEKLEEILSSISNNEIEMD